MFKKLTDGFQSTLAQAGEQAKARNSLPSNNSPRTSTSVERPPTTSKSTTHVPYEEGTMDSDNEEERPESKLNSDAVSHAEDSVSHEISPDMQKRLNKLAKYEKKYPELLKAYRALQTQDTNVKAFEKVLGEITPATSVSDIEAFQQWAQNFTIKAEMSMEELRRVSNVLEKTQADSTTQAELYRSELARCKQQIADLQADRTTSTNTNDGAEVESIDELKAQLTTMQQAHEQHITILKEERDVQSGATRRANKEVTDARQALAECEQKLIQSQNKLEHSQKDTQAEMEELQASRDTLRKELVMTKIAHAQELRDLSTSLPSPINIATAQEVVDIAETKTAITPNEEVSLSKSQKKRKNKKKSTTKPTGDDVIINPTKSTEMVDYQQITPIQKSVENDSHLQELQDLRLDCATLRAEAESFTEEKSNYERKIKRLQEHQESIEELRDMLKAVGDDLVEAKELNKIVTNQKIATESQFGHLKQQIVQNNAEIDDLTSKLSDAHGRLVTEEQDGQWKTRAEELQAQISILDAQNKTLAKDLNLAQILSAERFKELSTAKESLQSLNLEANKLRKEKEKLLAEHTTLEGLNKSSEARTKALERAERDRRDELEKSQKNLTSREKELKVIQSTFREEEVRRKSEESRAAILKAEVNKLTTLRDSILSSRNELTTQISVMRADLDTTNTKLSSLQQARNKLVQERDAAQEELELGKAKFASSYSLMESQREQTTDMQHRLRETTDKFDALIEELSEKQRQLTERNREVETLTKLLSDLENNQESRLREMRERMNSAIAERDKAEDEAAFSGKKRAREVEDLKEKLLDIERAQRRSNAEKEDLTASLTELRRVCELNKQHNDQKEQDTETLREAMSRLSRSLKEAETQISAIEGDRDSLQSALRDSTTKLERLQSEVLAKEEMLNKLRSERAHMLDRRDSITSPVRTHAITPRDRTPGSPVPSGLHRSPSLMSVQLNDKSIEKADVDREYIKNVLFQFFEHKDKRKYLLPAISKLLLFSKQQEGIFLSSLKS